MTREQNFQIYVNYKRAERNHQSLTPFKIFINGMTRLRKDIDKTDLTYKQKMVLYNTLLRNGITDSDQLHEMNEIDLLSIHGIGIMYLTRLEEAGLIKR